MPYLVLLLFDPTFEDMYNDTVIPMRQFHLSRINKHCYLNCKKSMFIYINRARIPVTLIKSFIT